MTSPSHSQTTSQPSSCSLAAHEHECAKRRVVSAYERGEDWRQAAQCNDVSLKTAMRAIGSGRTHALPRGGVRQSTIKMTINVMAKLEEYIDEDCCMTLRAMQDRLRTDNDAHVSLSTIQRAVKGMLYTMKAVRVKKCSMNLYVNKVKRKKFAKRLKAHRRSGDMVVYEDETNFNICLSRTQGRARAGERAVVVLPPSKGDNLHIQCGVAAGSWIVLMRTREGRILMPDHARFVANLFVPALCSTQYQTHHAGKKVVVVMDNASAHIQAETLVRKLLAAGGVMDSSKLVCLRLALYSPMLNPIEGCFSTQKAHKKKFTRTQRNKLFVRGSFDSFTKRRMALLNEAVVRCREHISSCLVVCQELHCAEFCAAVERLEDMVLGQ